MEYHLVLDSNSIEEDIKQAAALLSPDEGKISKNASFQLHLFYAYLSNLFN